MKIFKIIVPLLVDILVFIFFYFNSTWFNMILHEILVVRIIGIVMSLAAFIFIFVAIRKFISLIEKGLSDVHDKK